MGLVPGLIKNTFRDIPLHIEAEQCFLKYNFTRSIYRLHSVELVNATRYVTTESTDKYQQASICSLA